LIITVKKIAPVVLISYLMKIYIFTSTIILISGTVGAAGGQNQPSLSSVLGKAYTCNRRMLIKHIFPLALKA
jgi:hypothetical protein